MDLQLSRTWTVAFDSSVIELHPPRTWTELSLRVILASAQSDVLDQVLLNTSVYCLTTPAAELPPPPPRQPDAAPAGLAAAGGEEWGLFPSKHES